MADKKNILYFNTRDELLKVNLSRVACFEAEGNYIRILLVNGLSCMVRMSLGQMESVLASRMSSDKFARVGKRYIVNLSYVFSINVLKQELILSDQRFFQRNINVSRDALKHLKELIKESYSQIEYD